MATIQEQLNAAKAQALQIQQGINSLPQSAGSTSVPTPLYVNPNASMQGVTAPKPASILSSNAGQKIVNTNTQSLQKIESAYTGNSIVDYLKSANQPSDFASRTKMAGQQGIQGYTGTADQNTQLLGSLRNISGSPVSQTMVDGINKASGSGIMTSGEQKGLDDLSKTQDDVTMAAAKARAALEAKDYKSMDYWTAKAESDRQKYETQLSDYYASTKDLRDQLTKTLTPGAKEQQLNQKLLDVRSQADAFKLQTEQDKFNEYEGQTLGFAGGRASEIDMKASFKNQEYALQEKNLLLSLGLEQDARKMEGQAIEQQLGYIASDFELQQKVQTQLDAQEEALFAKAEKLEGDAKNSLISILDSLQGIDPAKMSTETMTQLETLSARSGLPFNLVTDALKTQHAKVVFDNLIKRSQETRLSQTPAPSTKGVVRSGGLEYSPQDAKEDSQALEASRGDDGYVDPAIYQKLYKLWISNGGLLKDFLLKYPPKDYVNPENTWLPPFLLPPKPKADSGIVNPFK
jgi:hypothetical protein